MIAINLDLLKTYLKLKEHLFNMIKILGSILIIMSGLLSGNLLFNYFKEKILFLEEFRKFIKHTKNEIEYKRSYPEVILDNFTCESKLNSYFMKCKSLMSNGENFPSAWEKTFYSCIYDEKKIILKFGKELGSYIFNEQISLCEFTENELSDLIFKMNKEIDKQKKVFITLGACFGAIISISLF